MKTPTSNITIAIVLCVILLIVFIMQPSVSASKTSKTSRSESIIAELEYQGSDGTFDNHAIRALNINNQIKNRTAADDYRAGNILELNVLQGDGIDGNADAAAIAANTPAVNLNATRTTISHYRNAVNRLMDRELATQNLDIVGGNDNFLQPAVILDHIMDFGERRLRDTWDVGFQHILENDLGNLNMVNALGIRNELIDLNINALAARRTNSENNIAKAAAVSKSKKEFASNFTALSLTHTSDPQNVHDSSVRVDNNNTLDIIRATTTAAPISDTIDEVQGYIKSANITEVQRAAALAVLNKIMEGETIMAYGETEDKILKYVWDRSKLKENAANAKNIKDAIVTALYQSTNAESRKPVCINGRVSNIIGALATLDANEEVGIAQTEEQYKNDIFKSAVDILNDEIADAKNEGGEMAKVAESYDDVNITAEPEHMQVFERRVKEKIDQVVDSHKDKIAPVKLNEIRVDAYVAAGLSEN